MHKIGIVLKIKLFEIFQSFHIHDLSFALAVLIQSVGLVEFNDFIWTSPLLCNFCFFALDVDILKNGPMSASFCLFSLFSHYNFNNTNEKKWRWCAWDLNLGPQDGRRRQHHGAMVATLEMLTSLTRTLSPILNAWGFVLLMK